MTNIADIRKDYKMRTLSETDVATDPFTQFSGWWQEAIDSTIDEVNAFTLATATPEGKPSARIVLLKGYDQQGFVFFTNYDSNKGNQLAHNETVAMVFFWKELERQVRIEGIAEKVSADESNQYFSSRPIKSKIGAWASPQSKVINSREVIEENVVKYEAKFDATDIPRPVHWGGYRVRPNRVEFWQGRRSRLHDRIQYTLQHADSWKIERLAP